MDSDSPTSGNSSKRLDLLKDLDELYIKTSEKLKQVKIPILQHDDFEEDPSVEQRKDLQILLTKIQQHTQTLADKSLKLDEVLIKEISEILKTASQGKSALDKGNSSKKLDLLKDLDELYIKTSEKLNKVKIPILQHDDFEEHPSVERKSAALDQNQGQKEIWPNLADLKTQVYFIMHSFQSSMTTAKQLHALGESREMLECFLQNIGEDYISSRFHSDICSHLCSVYGYKGLIGPLFMNFVNSIDAQDWSARSLQNIARFFALIFCSKIVEETFLSVIRLSANTPEGTKIFIADFLKAYQSETECDDFNFIIQTYLFHEGDAGQIAMCNEFLNDFSIVINPNNPI